jgi:hypothetical protein
MVSTYFFKSFMTSFLKVLQIFQIIVKAILLRNGALHK